jgi:AraC-like DNA-binding protein
MNDYTFFSYEANEALHVSDEEKITITSVVKTIENEFKKNLDVYSQDLIVTNIELLLNYCKRFYGRQFITRTNANKDVVVRFTEFIQSYFDSERPMHEGLPSVKYCARQMGYSTNYLSDLLKKETGKNTQEHIHFNLIEKAKTMLLGSQEPVSRIAYTLGFEYPQHFSKLFKNKTGMSPANYRA